MGASAITTRGLKENHMDTIADFIDRVIVNIESDLVITEVGKEVVKMMENRLIHLGLRIFTIQPMKHNFKKYSWSNLSIVDLFMLN